jgi:predicted type IV restriction endonuclease
MANSKTSNPSKHNALMDNINLPAFPFRLRENQGKQQIFDDIRKKYVALTPEEWVRQHFVKFLQLQCGYPATLMAIEMPVSVNGLKQRADIVVYNRMGKPSVIVECKAPSVAIDNQVFDQAARYNLKLNVSYLMVTNGLVHFCAKLDYENSTYAMMQKPPQFNDFAST